MGLVMYRLVMRKPLFVGAMGFALAGVTWDTRPTARTLSPRPRRRCGPR